MNALSRPVRIDSLALERELDHLIEEIEDISIQLEVATPEYFPAKDDDCSFQQWQYRARKARAHLKLRLRKVQKCLGLDSTEEDDHGES
jgi:hypothetical protein